LIPKIIHQIWIGDEPPDFIKQHMKNVKKMNKNFEYKFWGNDSIEYFNLEKEYKEATKYAFFVDILKIKILEKYGGVIIDADTECLMSLDDWFNKYKNNKISSYYNKDIYPDMGIIIAKPNLDYSIILNDFRPVESCGFYWQRMNPTLIPQEEVGLNGSILKHLNLNSWC